MSVVAMFISKIVLSFEVLIIVDAEIRLDSHVQHT
jgi:hypothetical protein